MKSPAPHVPDCRPGGLDNCRPGGLPSGLQGRLYRGLLLRKTLDEKGFTLAEIAVALGIFSFALVSMLGLLSVGMKSSRTANVQTAATNLLASITADIQSSAKDTRTQGSVIYRSPKLSITTTVNNVTKEVASVDVPASREATSGMRELTLSESGAPPDPAQPSLLEKSFRVMISTPASGTMAVRVRIEWPAQRAPSAKAEGFIETLAPLPF